MDIHKKHETDLTKEEKRQLEKEKLAGMDWKHKLEYIWDYYKPQIFGVIAFFLLIWGGISWYHHAQQETILYAVALDSYFLGDVQDEVEEDFKEYLGDEDENHVITIDTSVTSASDNSQVAYNSTVKMSTIVAAGAVDIVIGPADYLDQYVEQDAVYDLTEILPADLTEQLQDRIVDGKRLSLDGNAFLQEKLNNETEDVQLVVLTLGQNKETAVRFIEYILEQE